MIGNSAAPRLRVFGALAACLLVTAGCAAVRSARSSIKKRVRVIVEPDSYSPVQSSRVGIGLKPVYAMGRHSPLVRFHWRANYGHFVRWDPPDYRVQELGMNVATKGGKIYWTYDPIEIDAEDKPPVEIMLHVRDVRTQKSLAWTRVRLKWTDLDTVELTGAPAE